MIAQTKQDPIAAGPRMSAGTVAAAAIADTVLVLVFAAIGRDTHQRGESFIGVLLTAWPFLAGAAMGWLVFRIWRSPLSVRPAGLAVWIGAVAGGMILRLLTGQVVVFAFVVVAFLSLGILLAGYRLLVAGLGRYGRARRLR